MYNLNQETETTIKIKTINGYIYLDTTDVELPKKADKALAIINKAEQEFNSNSAVARNQKSEEKMLDSMIKFIDRVYEAINILFGKGATDMLFRVKSIAGVEMFLEKLPEILEEAGVREKTEDYFLSRQEALKATTKPLENNEVEVLD